MTATELEHLLLQNDPQAAVARFADLLTEAQSRHAPALIEQLAQIAEPFLAQNPALRQWHTYALGYLALTMHQRPDQAAAHLETLRAQWQSLPPMLAGRVLNGLGIIYETNEQWDKAAGCYQQSIDYYQSTGDDLGLGKTLSNLAIIFYKGQEYETALSHLERSIVLLNNHPDEKAWQLPLGRAWNELGLNNLALNRLEEARYAFKMYQSISERWGYLMGRGTALINLGHTYRQEGNFVAAGDCYTSARQFLAAEKDYYNFAEALFGAAQVNPTDNELLVQAKNAANQANNHEISTEIHLALAGRYEAQNNREEALQETLRAVQTVESLRANITFYDSRIRLQGARITAYEQAVRRLIAYSRPIANAFKYVEMAKARGLVDMLSGRSVKPPAQIPPAWMAQLYDLRNELESLYQSPPELAATRQPHIDRLEQQYNDLREQIHLNSPDFHSLQTVAPMSLAEAQALLPIDAILLEYFIAADTIYVFKITATEAAVYPLKITATQLKQAFEAAPDGKFGYLRRLTPAGDDTLAFPWILERLHEALLAPLGRAVWDAPLVAIVPHGMLHYIPFHALCRRTAAGEVEYFGGNGARSVLYAPSATVLLNYCHAKPQSPHANVLAVGFNGPRLTRAEAEALTVAGWFEQGQTLIGHAATRQSLIDRSRTARLLHISSHGWFNAAWPLSSAFALADGTFNTGDVLETLSLQADLVTLSACETGKSRILAGDELTGLNRAFLYAGAAAVMASHWLVDELSTQLLMECFYRQWHAEQQAASALGKAQAELRRLTAPEVWDILAPGAENLPLLREQIGFLSRRYNNQDKILDHPYYWSGFFLTGGIGSG